MFVRRLRANGEAQNRLAMPIQRAFSLVTSGGPALIYQNAFMLRNAAPATTRHSAALAPNWRRFCKTLLQPAYKTAGGCRVPECCMNDTVARTETFAGQDYENDSERWLAATAMRMNAFFERLLAKRTLGDLQQNRRTTDFLPATFCRKAT